MRSTDMYAGKLNDGTLFHFYPGKILITSVCGCPEAFKVRVTEADPAQAPPDSYWGWWDYRIGRFTLVYPTRHHVDICFPGGLESEEKRGREIALPVTIEYINE